MFIMHVALQGCVRARNVPYGITNDTGGHIRYVLDLIDALEEAGVARQELIVRRFSEDRLGQVFEERTETISPSSGIVRIDGGVPGYLRKEDLGAELEPLWQSLREHIEALPIKPDLVHAHYVAAGALAMRVKDAFGIPFLFTAHSLARVKAAAGKGTEADPKLGERIRWEEEVLASASRLIASSRDEADVQYRLYPTADKAKIRVIPPGCLTETFSNDRLFNNKVGETINRSLSDPDKPPILALARPTWKKNLHGLVEAYGRSPELQQRANLVIFAGCRQRLDDLDDEARDVMATIFKLVDDYDLYGRISLPKRHEPDDVPDVYRYVNALRGVFVNASFNEPFGLTLLEAAASGVPVVATNSGGPREIIERLKNGVCTDPSSPDEIANAILSVLDNDEAWSDMEKQGLDRIGHYSWSSHAERYLEEARAVLQPKTHFLSKRSSFSRLLVSDIDNTLVGCPNGLRSFCEWYADQKDYCFALATGRGLQSALEILRQHRTPSPSVIITGVGTEIYYAHDENLRDLSADRTWWEQISENWDAAAVADVIARIPGTTPQPLIDQSPVKMSYFVDDPARRREIVEALEDHGLAANVVFSHGRYLDVLPRRASKGAALTYLAEAFGVAPPETIAAGDSGNDEHMLRTAGMGVVVANHARELDALAEFPTAFFAKRPFAGGILEGLEAHREQLA